MDNSTILHGRVTKEGKAIDYDKRVNPDEETMVVKFINVQDPGHSVAFDLGVPVESVVPLLDSKGKKIIDDATGEPKTRRLTVNEFEHYHLLDQRIYKLPKRVVQHLNTLRYPLYENGEDPQTGQLMSRQVGWTNRFSTVPVDLLPDDQKGLGKKAMKDPVMQSVKQPINKGASKEAST